MSAPYKVERRAPYQGLPAYGITGCSEIAANRATAQKWADIANREAAQRAANKPRN